MTCGRQTSFTPGEGGTRRERDSPGQIAQPPDPHAGQVLCPRGDKVGIRGRRYRVKTVELETFTCSKGVGVGGED